MSLLKRAMKFFARFMKEIVVIIPVLSLSWLKLFVMDFIGSRLMLKQSIWSLILVVVS